MQSNIDVVWQDRAAGISYFFCRYLVIYIFTFLFRLKNTIQMPNFRCSVGGSNSDSSLSDKIVKRSHVKELKFHHFEKDESKRQLWKVKVDKDLNGFIVSDNKYVCSNYF